ncbi:MAG: monovalent cation/H+ antiporter subunit D family protein [Acidobacteriota bacterium]
MSDSATHGVVQLADQLPVLQVVLPMLTAPLCVLVRDRRATWLLATAAAWATLGISIALLRRVLTEGAWSYAVGGWLPPMGIELRLELVNAFVLLIVSGVSAIVLTAARRSFDREIPASRHYLAYSAFLLAITGLLGMTSAGDAFNVFVFLEISSLASYSLIALGRRRQALSSALRYLMIGTIGGTFLLLGIGMLYMATGTLNITDLGVRLAGMESNRTVLVALACITIGTTIKLALLPLGAWLPNAYTFAPSVVTAFLAATATKVAYYVLLRFIFRVFGAPTVFETFDFDLVLLPLAVGSMFVGSLLAIWEPDVKRLLAYSSLAQIGYMVLGLSLATRAGLIGGVVHLFNHALMKSGLFLVLAAIALRLGSTRLDSMCGLSKRMPWTAAAFVLGGLSLIGVPATVGFVSKWFLVRGAFERGSVFIAGLILISSLLSLVYVWRVVEAMYFREVSVEVESAREAPASLLIPAWALILACLWFGLSTDRTVGVASLAVDELLAPPQPVVTAIGAPESVGTAGDH